MAAPVDGVDPLSKFVPRDDRVKAERNQYGEVGAMCFDMSTTWNCAETGKEKEEAYWKGRRLLESLRHPCPTNASELVSWVNLFGQSLNQRNSSLIGFLKDITSTRFFESIECQGQGLVFHFTHGDHVQVQGPLDKRACRELIAKLETRYLVNWDHLKEAMVRK